MFNILEANNLKIKSSQVDLINNYILTNQQIECQEGYEATILRGCIKFTDSNLSEKKMFLNSRNKTIRNLEKFKNTKDVLKLLVLTESINLFPKYINNMDGIANEALYGTLEGILKFLKKHKIKSIKATYFPPTVKAGFYLDGTFKFGYILNR